MQPTNGQPRLSSEMMATGDALRHCIIQVNNLSEAQNPAVANQPATAVLLVDGPNVAEALEVLAQRLGVTS